MEDLELPIFYLATIAGATDNFSPNNKLGEGGSGSVYKGILDDGLEIAVKGLSKGSTQIGDNEFRNEVEQIAQLQHRDSAKLLGCYIHHHHIINGIACRLLYLHRDSLQRVIHRVLKAV